MTADPKHVVEYRPAVLVEVTRGHIVESWHFGAIAVADVEGNLLAWAGDPETVSYYRSSSKPLQALPLVESGAADHYGLTDAEIALTCGSHGGEDIHVQGALSILKKVGLTADALACGPHMPYDRAAASELQARGGSPTALHNNCSGKHAGMLALAKFHGWPVGGYEMAIHPVQKTMLAVVAEFAGLSPDAVAVGVDGCGVSTFGMSVRRMAMSFAWLGQPDYWPEPRRSALRRIIRAMIAHPEMVSARQERFDLDMTRAAQGTLVGKVGAEGVYCAVRLATDGEPAVGFALKIMDGDPQWRARNPAVVEGLRQAGMIGEEAVNRLEPYWQEEIHNRPGDVVGVVRPAFTLSAGVRRGV